MNLQVSSLDHFGENEFLIVLDRLIQQMPGFVAFKTVDSIYASANELCAKLAGYKNVNSYIGTTDYEWKCEAVKFAEEIRRQDQLVLQGKQSWNSFNILKFDTGDVTCYFSQKSVLRHPNGKVLGLLFVGTILPNFALSKVLSLLNLSHQINKQNKLQHNIYPIIEGNKQNNTELDLSQRESECVFYLLRGKTSKEIGKVLNISNRTAEAHIEHVKEKFNCKTKSQMIEKAINLGYFYHIPETLINSRQMINSFNNIT